MAVDPILLCPLPAAHEKRFAYTRPNGLVVEYACESLVDYLLCSGQFREPETRLPFSDGDLRRLDKQAKTLGLHKESVLRAKYCRDWSEKTFRTTALQGLDRVIGEIFSHVLTVVDSSSEEEGGGDPSDDVQLDLLSQLQTVADYYMQMRGVDRRYAEMCLDMHVTYLRGPKNRPTRDPFGLLKMCCDFIASFRRSPFFFVETNQGLAVMPSSSGASSMSTNGNSHPRAGYRIAPPSQSPPQVSSAASGRLTQRFDSHRTSARTPSERFSAQFNSSSPAISLSSAVSGGSSAGASPSLRLD